MVSANIAYNEFVDSELVEKVVKPAFLELGYEVTNYHCVGEAAYPNPTLISIRENPREGEKKCLTGALKDLRSTAETIAKGAKASRERANTLENSCIWLDNPNIIGSYSDNETAETLFPQVALEYAIQNVNEVLGDIKDELNSFGEALKDL
ncbi:hypothetical protein A3K73_09445 [Candidatus Pacearchaeota archaeon RBG_13_36_9]|nr:MAG: hypothetical protein A3K73_09445 [Candidatus Pacearchaeota archaeon RBG_13_36_9]